MSATPSPAKKTSGESVKHASVLSPRMAVGVVRPGT